MSTDEQEFAERRRELSQRAELGHPTLCHELAEMCSAGQGGPEDPAEAARLYRIAAEEDFAPSAHNLAVLHAQGRGVEQDYAEALRWYRKAASLGDVNATFKVGVMHALGEGMDPDPKTAEKLWRKAAAQGHGPATLFLGNLHNAQGRSRNVVEAGRWYVAAAELDVPEATGALTTLQDELRTAAEEGDITAQYLMGRIYHLARGDASEAAYWYGHASRHGHPAACTALGKMHETGDGVEQDRTKAFEAFELAATRDEPEALYRLAMRHFEGEQEGDEEKALEDLEQAAELGHAAAFMPLADELAIRRREESAAHWYLLAANAGNVDAMYEIADRYSDGTGIARDLVQAARWYWTMFLAGMGDGIHDLHGIVHEMSEQQLRKAASLAGEPALAEAAITAWLEPEGGA